MAVDRHAVVRAPVGHDAVHIRERALAGEPRRKPGGGPGGIGALVQGVVHIVGQGHGGALGDLQAQSHALNDVQAQHGYGHLRLGPEVAGESATTEVLVVGPAPVGGVQAGLHIRVSHLPEGLHLSARRTRAVQGGCAGVDQVDEAVLRRALRLPASDALHRVGAPVGTHVVEAGGGVRQQGTQQHAQAVEGIVLRGEGGGLTGAVPVEGGRHDGLGEVAVGQPVRPLPLALEATGHRVLAQSLLMPAQLVQLGVAEHQVADDHAELGDELPVLVRIHHLAAADNPRQILAGVHVEALAAVGLDPGKSLLVLGLIVDVQRHTAEDLRHVHPLGAQPQVLLHHLRVAEGAHDAHGHAADVQVGLVLHPAHGHRAPGEAQDLLRHVGGDGLVAHVLHITAVDGEGRQALLGVGRQHRRQIHRAGALRAVEAPHRLDGAGVHVEGLHAVAPAGGDGEGGHHILRGEELLAAGSLRAAADGAGADHRLHGGAVGIAQGFNQRLGCLSQAHGLGLQAFADTAPPAVDDGADADLRIKHDGYPPCFDSWPGILAAWFDAAPENAHAPNPSYSTAAARLLP